MKSLNHYEVRQAFKNGQNIFRRASVELLITRIEELESDRLRLVCIKLLDYRKRSGALNFQLEKADDFLNEIRIILAGG